MTSGTATPCPRIVTQPPDHTWLTVGECARIWGVSTPQARRYIGLGWASAIKVGAHLRVSRSSLTGETCLVPKPTLTQPELCRLWRVSRITVWRLAKRGAIARIFVHGQLRIARAEIEAFERRATYEGR